MWKLLCLMMAGQKRLPPVKENIYSRSKRRTPWTDKASATPIESFLDNHAAEEYSHRHPCISDTGESGFLNTFEPSDCPHCGKRRYKRYGYLRTGLRRYLCLELFSEQSFEAISKANRKAYNTTSYWIDKIFLALRGTQNGIMLSGDVYIDETYLKVSKRDVEKKTDGKVYRGISRNQIRIGIAYDGMHVYFCILGHGKPSQKSVYEAFKDHIAPCSTLIHGA